MNAIIGLFLLLMHMSTHYIDAVDSCFRASVLKDSICQEHVTPLFAVPSNESIATLETRARQMLSSYALYLVDSNCLKSIASNVCHEVFAPCRQSLESTEALHENELKNRNANALEERKCDLRLFDRSTLKLKRTPERFRRSISNSTVAHPVELNGGFSDLCQESSSQIFVPRTQFYFLGKKYGPLIDRRQLVGDVLAPAVERIVRKIPPWATTPCKSVVKLLICRSVFLSSKAVNLHWENSGAIKIPELPSVLDVPVFPDSASWLQAERVCPLVFSSLEASSIIPKQRNWYLSPEDSTLDQSNLQAQNPLLGAKLLLEEATTRSSWNTNRSSMQKFVFQVQYGAIGNENLATAEVAAGVESLDEAISLIVATPANFRRVSRRIATDVDSRQRKLVVEHSPAVHGSRELKSSVSCPEGFVVPSSNSSRVVWIDGTPCARRCLDPELSLSEWRRRQWLTVIISLASLPFMLTILYCWLFNSTRRRQYLVLIFTLSSLVVNIILLIMSIIGLLTDFSGSNMFCEDSALGWNISSGLSYCVFQAVILIYFWCLCCVSWCVQAVDLFVKVVWNANTSRHWPYHVAVILFLPAFPVLYGAKVGEIGFSGKVPWCGFAAKRADRLTSADIVGMYYPILAVSMIGLGCMCGVVAKIFKIQNKAPASMASPSIRHRAPLQRSLSIRDLSLSTKETATKYKAYRTPIIFTINYWLVMLSLLCLRLILQEKSSEIQADFSYWASCVFQNFVSDSENGWKSVCGEQPGHPLDSNSLNWLYICIAGQSAMTALIFLPNIRFSFPLLGRCWRGFEKFIKLCCRVCSPRRLKVYFLSSDASSFVVFDSANDDDEEESSDTESEVLEAHLRRKVAPVRLDIRISSDDEDDRSSESSSYSYDNDPHKVVVNPRSNSYKMAMSGKTGLDSFILEVELPVNSAFSRLNSGASALEGYDSFDEEEMVDVETLKSRRELMMNTRRNSNSRFTLADLEAGALNEVYQTGSEKIVSKKQDTPPIEVVSHRRHSTGSAFGVADQRVLLSRKEREEECDRDRSLARPVLLGDKTVVVNTGGRKIPDSLVPLSSQPTLKPGRALADAKPVLVSEKIPVRLQVDRDMDDETDHEATLRILGVKSSSHEPIVAEPIVASWNSSGHDNDYEASPNLFGPNFSDKGDDSPDPKLGTPNARYYRSPSEQRRSLNTRARPIRVVSPNVSQQSHSTLLPGVSFQSYSSTTANSIKDVLKETSVKLKNFLAKEITFSEEFIQEIGDPSVPMTQEDAEDGVFSANFTAAQIATPRQLLPITPMRSRDKAKKSSKYFSFDSQKLSESTSIGKNGASRIKEHHDASPKLKSILHNSPKSHHSDESSERVHHTSFANADSIRYHFRRQERQQEREYEDPDSHRNTDDLDDVVNLKKTVRFQSRSIHSSPVKVAVSESFEGSHYEDYGGSINNFDGDTEGPSRDIEHRDSYHIMRESGKLRWSGSSHEGRYGQETHRKKHHDWKEDYQEHPRSSKFGALNDGNRHGDFEDYSDPVVPGEYEINLDGAEEVSISSEKETPPARFNNLSFADKEDYRDDPANSSQSGYRARKGRDLSISIDEVDDNDGHQEELFTATMEIV